MKLSYLLSLVLTLVPGSKSHACGIAYNLPSGSSAPYGSAFSPNGSYLAIANSSSNSVTIFTVTGGVLSDGISYSLPSGSSAPYGVAFSPDGSYLATANSGSNNLTIFAVTEGVLNAGTSYTLPSGSSVPESVAFSPDGSYLASANVGGGSSFRGGVALFTVTEGVLSGGTSYALPSGSSEPKSVAFSPDGSYLATANSASGDVTLFTVTGGVLNDGTSYHLPSGSVMPTSVAFSPDGSYLATSNYGEVSDLKDVTVFTVAGGTLTNPLSYALPENAGDAISAAFSPDGSYLAIASYGSSSIIIFNVGTGGALSSGTSYFLPSGSSFPMSIAFSPNDSYVATANLLSESSHGPGDVALFSLSCLTQAPSTASTTGASTSLMVDATHIASLAIILAALNYVR